MALVWLFLTSMVIFIHIVAFYTVWLFLAIVAIFDQGDLFLELKFERYPNKINPTISNRTQAIKDQY